MSKPDFPNTPTPDEPGPDPKWEPEGETPATTPNPPPRRTGRARPRRASTDDPTPKRSPGAGRPTAGPARDLKGRLEELFAGMALVPMMTGDVYSAHIISSRAGHLAEAWADLAKQNPAVKRVLENLLTGGAWGGVVISTGAIIVPILGHYGVLPPIDPWQGGYDPAPVKQGRRPIVPPAPGGGGRGTTPPNPRRNGAGTPDTNSPGGGDAMTAPVAPGQPPGVVTVAGSGNRAD